MFFHHSIQPQNCDFNPELTTDNTMIIVVVTTIVTVAAGLVVRSQCFVTNDYVVCGTTIAHVITKYI